MPSKELKKYTELSAQMNPDDVQPINSMINAALKNLGGRPATYPFNEAGLNSLVQNSLSYFDYVEKANSKIDDNRRSLILDVDSYATYLGISKKTLSEYQKRNDTWNKTISLFKDAIGSSKKQLALHGLIPSVMAVFDLCNNHDYVNTSEFKLTTNDSSGKKEMADNDLESRIEEAGLVWDNDLREYVPKED